MREVLEHVTGESPLPVQEIPTPDVATIRRELGLSRDKFAERFDLDARAIQEWEQGRRKPDRAARAYLRVIQRNPQAVEDALRMD